MFLFQEKFLRYRLAKTIGIKGTSKRKQHFSNGCRLDLNSIADSDKERIEAEMLNILSSCDYNPENVLKYISKHGTKVIYSSDSKKILHPIRENEGFIYPTNGLKALYLSLALFKVPKLKTKEMFVLSKGEINKYYFLYQFYNWYSYKNNIDGMDVYSQKLLKKYLFTQNDTKELQLADIYKLKDAIKQDKFAIEFVIKLCKNYDGAKNALEKLKNGGAKL